MSKGLYVDTLPTIKEFSPEPEYSPRDCPFDQFYTNNPVPGVVPSYPARYAVSAKYKNGKFHCSHTGKPYISCTGEKGSDMHHFSDMDVSGDWCQTKSTTSKENNACPCYIYNDRGYDKAPLYTCACPPGYSATTGTKENVGYNDHVKTISDYQCNPSQPKLSTTDDMLKCCVNTDEIPAVCYSAQRYQVCDSHNVSEPCTPDFPCDSAGDRKYNDGRGFCPVGYCPRGTGCQAAMDTYCAGSWDSNCDKYLANLGTGTTKSDAYKFIENLFPKLLAEGKITELDAAEMCGKYPGACDNFLQAKKQGGNPAPGGDGWCTQYTRDDLGKLDGDKLSNLGAQQLCGCFLYPDRDNYPLQGDNIDVACDFLCNTAAVHRGKCPKSGECSFVNCKEPICVMDDITLNIINSKTGDISFTEMCGNCSKGAGSCQCYFSNISANVIQSLIDKGIHFSADCGGNCFTKDQKPITCPTGTCDDKHPCPPNFKCVSGSCQPISGKCDKDKPCRPGYECIEGDCVLKPTDGSFWDKIKEWWEESTTHKVIIVIALLLLILTIIFVIVLFFYKGKSSTAKPLFTGTQQSDLTYET